MRNPPRAPKSEILRRAEIRNPNPRKPNKIRIPDDPKADQGAITALFGFWISVILSDFGDSDFGFPRPDFGFRGVKVPLLA
jgi:hypothetical protein